MCDESDVGRSGYLDRQTPENHAGVTQVDGVMQGHPMAFPAHGNQTAPPGELVWYFRGVFVVLFLSN